MGFMQSQSAPTKWEFCLAEWGRLSRYASRVKADYLAIYQRECWAVKDGEIDTLESLVASREKMRALGKVYSYWGE